MNLLPAILIGGPPNAGKSVLFYSLTMALYERGIKHHIVRACPDGEGNWYQEIHRSLDPEIARLIKVQSRAEWTPAFVEGICRDLEHRHTPLLVDVGGRPQSWQQCILHQCTHSILLYRDPNDEATHFWQQLLGSTQLLPLAILHSTLQGESILTEATPRSCFASMPIKVALQGESILTEATPVIRGTLTGLERGTRAQGPVFDALVNRIAALFATYPLAELEQAQLQKAPAEPVVLPDLLRKFDAGAQEWKPAMLRLLAGELPSNKPLAIYGKGPGWLYSALAVQVGEQPFYQFDPRIGWMKPPHLESGTEPVPEGLTYRLYENSYAQILSIKLNNEYLDYLQAERMHFPPIQAGRGLILNGKMPLWLLTALVRLYHAAQIPWIACYQPQVKGAVVVLARSSEYTIGDVIAMPMPLTP